MWLLVNRSFYPDTEAAGEVLTALARSLAREFPITVICGLPYATDPMQRRLIVREQLDGLRIVRIRHTRFSKASSLGRICNWLSFSALAFWVGLRLRPSGIIIATDPPLLAAVGTALRTLVRCDLIISCQDLYAEVAIEIGKVSRGWAFRLLDRSMCLALQRAEQVVALSTDMAERLNKKGVALARIEIIPNGVDTNAIVPIGAADNCLIERLNPDRRFVVMYAGNLGLAQDFDALLAGLRLLRAAPQAWRMIFVGDGVRRQELLARVAALGLDDNVRFVERQPSHKLSELLSLGTLHVVPVRLNLIGCVAPSKVYGILAVGRPYLAIADRECEFVSAGLAGGYASWAAPGDAGGVAQQIDWAIEHRTELERMGVRARAQAFHHHDLHKTHASWHALLRRFAASPPRRGALPT